MRRTLLQAMLVVLVFDAAAALAARTWHFDYGRLTIGSDVIYFVAGFVAGWRHAYWSGVVVGAGVGLVDALIGWPIAAVLGPPALAAQYHATPFGPIVMTIMVVAGMGAVFGGAGGVVGALIHGRGHGHHPAQVTS